MTTTHPWLMTAVITLPWLLLAMTTLPWLLLAMATLWLWQETGDHLPTLVVAMKAEIEVFRMDNSTF